MKPFTYEDVLQILANVGVKADCGACMEQAFTGMTDHDHNCGRENPKLVIEFGPMFVLFKTLPERWVGVSGDTNLRDEAKCFTEADALVEAARINAPIRMVPAEQSTQERPTGEADIHGLSAR